MIKKTVLSAVMAMMTITMSAQVDAILGEWITLENGKQESVVKIFQATNGRYYGKITQVVAPGHEDAVCEKCSGEDKNKPLAGLMIIRNMQADGDHLSGGEILDPRRGKWFNCTIKTDGDKLAVRGSLGPFGETKTWIRK